MSYHTLLKFPHPLPNPVFHSSFKNYCDHSAGNGLIGWGIERRIFWDIIKSAHLPFFDAHREKREKVQKVIKFFFYEGPLFSLFWLLLLKEEGLNLKSGLFRKKVIGTKKLASTNLSRNSRNSTFLLFIKIRNFFFYHNHNEIGGRLKIENSPFPLNFPMGKILLKIVLYMTKISSNIIKRTQTPNNRTFIAFFGEEKINGENGEIGENFQKHQP